MILSRIGFDSFVDTCQKLRFFVKYSEISEGLYDRKEFGSDGFRFCLYSCRLSEKPLATALCGDDSALCDFDGN